VEGGFEDFLRAYAGLLVDGLMIAEFAYREGSIIKQCGWLAPSKLIGTHRLAI